MTVKEYIEQRYNDGFDYYDAHIRKYYSKFSANDWMMYRIKESLYNQQPNQIVLDDLFTPNF